MDSLIRMDESGVEVGIAARFRQPVFDYQAERGERIAWPSGPQGFLWLHSEAVEILHDPCSNCLESRLAKRYVALSAHGCGLTNPARAGRQQRQFASYLPWSPWHFPFPQLARGQAPWLRCAREPEIILSLRHRPGMLARASPPPRADKPTS